ncbi:MAG: Na+/H+ antiporter NhaA [Legionellales bacterium]|nr:Na+/H+ antiporter NhaA [Legionellales bacterium]
MIRYIQRFIDQSYFGSLVLIALALLALITVNSPLESFYVHALSLKMGFHVGSYILSKPMLMWINDGLMTIFFLLVGIEIKRELLEGELNSFNKAILPIIAAFGGMLVPSLIFVAINWHQPVALRGWAIPSATDIAFALGVLCLLSKRIPASLKIFLTALAIIDDLGAIVIIALFYSNELSWVALALAACCVVILFLLNYLNVVRFGPYLLVGVIMWFCVLQSGVHATLTGVILAFAYPLRDRDNPQSMPSHHIELKLLPWVNYFILPLFAFANAGVPLNTVALSSFTESVPLGTILGLFIGKQVGVFTSCWIAVKLKWASLPLHATWRHLYVVAILAGIGFTMSLFIGTLAYDGLSVQYIEMVRLGVLVGSFLSAIVASIIAYTLV